MRLIFPENFYWGSATSGHQVEGNNHNDWSEWEKVNAERLVRKAKQSPPTGGWPDYILERYPNPLQEENYISGRACDHYNRFREDFDIAKSLGHNAHRFSIEWSRIEPEEGKFDEKEIEHYREVIKALRERGIEPFVTLWHWTIPLWMRDKGGWGSKEIVYYFSRFCERIAKEFQNEVRYWMIINEPEFWFGHAYLSNIFPVPKRSLKVGLAAYFNLVRGHKETYKKLKAVNPLFSVGVVESTGWISPEPIRWLAYEVRNFIFPWLVCGYFDFFGLNYYRNARILGKTKGAVSDVGWEIYQEGFYHNIKAAYRRFKKPIFITENGIADVQDEKRADFIKEHLKWVHKAISEGADVRGYFYWSLLDNFEWDKGFWPRFGLVEIDYKTMERKIRNSALEYAKICRENAL